MEKGSTILNTIGFTLTQLFNNDGEQVGLYLVPNTKVDESEAIFHEVEQELLEVEEDLIANHESSGDWIDEKLYADHKIVRVWVENEITYNQW